MSNLDDEKQHLDAVPQATGPPETSASYLKAPVSLRSREREMANVIQEPQLSAEESLRGGKTGRVGIYRARAAGASRRGPIAPCEVHDTRSGLSMLIGPR